MAKRVKNGRERCDVTDKYAQIRREGSKRKKLRTTLGIGCRSEHLDETKRGGRGKEPRRSQCLEEKGVAHTQSLTHLSGTHVQKKKKKNNRGINRKIAGHG